jgi:signal transduction histidine kinase
MAHEPEQGRSAFLSTIPATPGERRLALAVVAISTLVFFALVPFAKLPLAKQWAFIPIYQSALIVNDLITAVLLFGQYRILHQRALLILANGYLFTAFIAALHMLTFPGLFSPTGLLGAGAQSTAWIFMFWHGVFPLFVIGYALLKSRAPEQSMESKPMRYAVLLSVSAVAALVGAFIVVATLGHDFLPAIMIGGHYTPIMIFVVSSVWTLSVLALIVLWRRRPRSVLDVWLMVVMIAWLFDIALAAVLNGGRFDLGFYAGRIYGLMAASFVLMVLLLENGMLYARLVDTHERERRKTEELTAANKELEAFSYSVSHDLRAPLRGVDGFARLLQDKFGDQMDSEAHNLLDRVRAGSQRMGALIDDLLAFSRSGRQPLRTERVDMDQMVNQVIGELRADDDQRRIDFIVDNLGAVDADPALLKQALVNLISNAIKFTRYRDAARVEVRREDIGQERVYSVKDNGAGFDMRYADKLFGVFQRLHGAKEYEGTGVGLAIVQRIIDRHGGRIWVDAAENQGAAFYFTLPASSST